jgi:hypothetical protein
MHQYDLGDVDEGPSGLVCARRKQRSSSRATEDKEGDISTSVLSGWRVTSVLDAVVPVPIGAGGPSASYGRCDGDLYMSGLEPLGESASGNCLCARRTQAHASVDLDTGMIECGERAPCLLKKSLVERILDSQPNFLLTLEVGPRADTHGRPFSTHHFHNRIMKQARGPRVSSKEDNRDRTRRAVRDPRASGGTRRVKRDDGC